MDLLLKRYSNIEYVFNMELFDFMQLLTKAIKKDKEEKLYTLWIAEMAKWDKPISFEDYLKRFEVKKIDNKTNKEDALAKAQNIKNLDQKGGK